MHARFANLSEDQGIDTGSIQRPSSHEQPRSASSTSGPEADKEMSSDDIHAVQSRNINESSDEDCGQVYLGVVWSGGKLGVAYYDVDNGQINIMLDAVETDDFQLLNRICHQIQPTNIITSTKQDERLMKALKPEDTEESPMGKSPDFIQILPSIDFSHEICKRRILALNLPSIPQHFTHSERFLYISSLIPLEKSNMVKALGGLLKFLDKNRIGVELEELDVRIPVLEIKIFSLDDLMIIDDNTYRYPRQMYPCVDIVIFQREAHPSVYKCGSSGSAKEGLSLFGIMNRCRSKIGSRMLRLWFLRPLKNAELIKERQDAVSFLANPRNIETLHKIQDSLKHMRPVSNIVTRMTQAQASMGDWQALYKTAYNAIYIGDICRSQPTNVPIFRQISQKFTEDLNRVASLINKIVDFEESAVQNRFVVKPGVDTELDEKKRTYNGLPNFMTTVAREELDRLGEEISKCNIIYLPQLGYLLAIPLNDNLTKENGYQIDGLDFMFVTNNLLHYKSARTRELDNMLGDTQCEITDQETAIMHKLQNSILEYSKVLVDVMNYAAQLDCLQSLAVCAKEYNYVRPEITSSSVIQIKGGRHPLQELCCSPYVPNATLSGGKYGKMKILSGPNASGKSVYLKQIPLIVFMANIGSFVPAEHAVIGITDRIFTRIRTMESVSVALSTFMIDLNQVAVALRSATSRSLVILDEFGKGTETLDGLSLLTSCLRFWLSKKENCPHVFVSTHFHSIIQQQLLPKSPQLNYMTMEVLQDGDDLVFLYQLIEGSTNTSYACHIAYLAGLPPEIIQRGTEVSELLKKNQPVHRVDTASTEAQFQRCSTIVDKFLELDFNTTDPSKFLQDFVIPVSEGKNSTYDA